MANKQIKANRAPKTESTNMEVEDPPTTSNATQAVQNVTEPQKNKRKYVTLQGTEYIQIKKRRAAPDQGIKHRILSIIIHYHLKVLEDNGIKALYNKIDLVSQITGTMFTAHNIHRQAANKRESPNIHKFGGETVLKCGEQNDRTVQNSVFVETWSYLVRLYGVDYSNKDEIGPLSAYIALFHSFNSRYSEVRNGLLELSGKKLVDGRQERTTIRSMGLEPYHGCLFKGSSFSPVLQSAQKQQLGPMTLAFNLMKSERGTLYIRQWKEAFIQSFSYLPNVSSIADHLEGNRLVNHTLLRALADVALLGGNFSLNKAYFPVAMLLHHYNDNLDSPTTRNCPNIPLNDVPDIIKQMDFSGAGMWKFWNGASGHDYSMRCQQGTSSEMVRQAIMHGVFGTHLEDLSLVKWMIGGRSDLYQRRDMRNMFQVSQESTDVEFRIIPFIRVSKLVSASATGKTSSRNNQILRCPTFAGKCEVPISQESDIAKIMFEDSLYKGIVSDTPETMLHVINAYKKEELLKAITQRKIEYKSADFYVYEEGPSYGDKIEGPVQLESRFFFNRDDSGLHIH